MKAVVYKTVSDEVFIVNFPTKAQRSRWRDPSETDEQFIEYALAKLKERGSVPNVEMVRIEESELQAVTERNPKKLDIVGGKLVVKAIKE